MLTEKNTLAPVKTEYSGPMVGTSVIVRRPDGMVLMGVRKGAHGAGKYSFPGGKEDHGESPDQSARRELREEAGIDAEVSLFLPHPMVSRVFEETGNHWLTIYYIAEVGMDADPKVMEPKKCAGWEWVDPADLPRPLFEPIANTPELIAALATLSKQ